MLGELPSEHFKASQLLIKLLVNCLIEMTAEGRIAIAFSDSWLLALCDLS